MANWLDIPLLRVMEKGLDAASLRQKVLADNIANLETPDFKRSDVKFDQVFQEALGQSENLVLKVTNSEHLTGTGESSGNVIVTDPGQLHSNGNNVNIDREMTNVAENNIYYSALTRASSMYTGILRLLINQK